MKERMRHQRDDYRSQRAQIRLELGRDDRVQIGYVAWDMDRGDLASAAFGMFPAQITLQQ